MGGPPIPAMSSYWVLRGKQPIQVLTVLDWARDFETNPNRHMFKTMIGEYFVSTVFLGIDHSFGEGPPLLFETMVFGGTLAGEQRRYSTWDEAEQGHNELVEQVEAADGARRNYR